MKRRISIPFNPVNMTASDMMACVKTLRLLLQDFQRHEDNPEEFHACFMQIVNAYEVED